MEFVAKSGQINKQNVACLIVGSYDNGNLTPCAEQIDDACGGQISQLQKLGDISGKPGEVALFHPAEGIKAKRVMVVGLGSADGISDKDYLKAIIASATRLKELDLTNALSALCEASVKDQEMRWKARQLVLNTSATFYSYRQTLTKNAPKKPSIKEFQLFTESSSERHALANWVSESASIAAAIERAKNLANLPGNVCTPTYLANIAQDIGKSSSKLKVSVLDEAKMEKLGMGALLSVSRGSRQPAKLIVMEYKGATAKQKPVVFVGKGLTFDAGGISLKQSSGMDEMKYDMCGGASVIAAMEMCATLELPINVVGIVPSSENLPDGDANKPGDVVTSMSGQTIEILNTDAEGRLILCDALTYAERFKPEIIIDMATLTGACIVALGRHPSGLLANDEALAQEIIAAGQKSGDRVWQLPLWDDYQDQLKSSFADMANIGGPDGGTITAACFLARYTEKYRWAHLDIAGTAWKTGALKGATGRPVHLLAQLLLDRCEA